MSDFDRAVKYGASILYLALLTRIITRPRGAQIIDALDSQMSNTIRSATGTADLCDCGDDRRLHSDPPVYTGELIGGWESDDLR